MFQYLGWGIAAAATPGVMFCAGGAFFGLSLAANQGISVAGMDPAAMAVAGAFAGAVTQVGAGTGPVGAWQVRGWAARVDHGALSSACDWVIQRCGFGMRHSLLGAGGGACRGTVCAGPEAAGAAHLAAGWAGTPAALRCCRLMHVGCGGVGVCPLRQVQPV